MAESQSRYGIMEQLNQRKMEESKKLAALQQAQIQEEKQVEERKQQLTQDILLEEGSCEGKFQAWKRLRELDLKQLKQQHLQEVERREQEIKQQEKTYKQTSVNIVESLRKDLNGIESRYLTWKQLKKVEENNIIEQIKIIDESIASLKDISKESN